MQALLLFVLVLIVGTLVVTRDALEAYQPVAQPTPSVVRQVAVVPTPRVVPTVSPRPPALQVAGDILSIAQQWLGTRYQWGGCTRNGVDCSCFVQNVYRALGVSVPRTTKPQFQWGNAVPRDDVQLGDLVFFNNTCQGCGPNPTHVGLAITNTMMIHCGDPCQVAAISSFREYAGARRPA